MSEELMLSHALDLERLQAAQDDFARRTGLALITVACTGRPLTEASRFTAFCAIMRSDPQQRRRCEGCDAHGGLQSVMDGRPSVYRCHAGLVDFSVPIMRDETYLGAILCGQVRLADASSVPYLTTLNSGWQRNADVVRAWHRVPLTDLESVHASAADLANLAADLVVRRPQRPSPSVEVQVVTPQATSRRLTPLPAQALEAAVAREDLVAQCRILTAALDHLFSDGLVRISPGLLQPLEDAIVRGASQVNTASGLELRQAVTRQRAARTSSVDRHHCHDHLQSLLFAHHDRMAQLPRGPRTFTDLLNHLERHAQRPPTLQQAADYLSITPSHLSKVFRQRTGQTFISHVTAKRIERARHLLVHTDLPVARIAQELGFQPVNYFSRTFKSHVGMTPSEYRRRGASQEATP